MTAGQVDRAEVPQLVVLPNWRAEVADIARTLRDAERTGPISMAVLGRSRAMALSTIGRLGDAALLVSDLGTTRAERLLRRTWSPKAVLRLWWNYADEVLEHQADAANGQEVAVSFFDDVGDELGRAGVDVVVVPYAFTATTPVERTTELTIGYTGEVDVSETCFAPAGPKAAVELSERAWSEARDVVTGRRSLVEVDVGLDAPGSAPLPIAQRTMLWAVRNRVRFLLVEQVAAAHPAHLNLRGNDWRVAGFEASRTTFRRRVRMQDYRTHRVSLDLGSKSTHAALYPRTADIMAVGGGLVQMASGGPPPSWSETLGARRAGSGDALLALVDRLLSASADAVAAESAEIQRDYAAVRTAAGRLLLETAARCRDHEDQH